VSKGHDFDAIFRETGPRLWRALLAYTGGRRDVAEDALSEAFARAISRSGSITAPEAYVYRVAFRVAAAELKRERRRGDVPDRAVLDEPILGELFLALRQLPPTQRAAIYLRYQADLPANEIGKLMGTSAAVVRMHLMRGRRRLAELLAEEEDVDA
jgi:RNA polymerase sigma factor (sigma-70 family)